MVAFAPEVTLSTSQIMMIPVFPPRMLLAYVHIPARVDNGAGSGTVQLGLYRIVQPTLILPTPVPKVSKHEFNLVQRLVVSYYNGSLSAAVTAIAGTALISLQSYTRVVGKLENTRILRPNVQYAIGIRPLGTYPIELPSSHLLADAPCYIRSSLSANSGALPQSVVADSRERTPILTLLSPQGANILVG